MALTATEVTTIRRLLGYADRNREAYWSLEAVAASITAETETAVRDLLTKVATLETQLVSLGSRAGLKRAEDVEFYQGSDGYSSLRDEGDRLVTQIASLLNIEIRHSAFRPRSAGGPCGRA